MVELLAYHSTSEKNISSILKNGFSQNWGKGFGSTFGNGIYTSPELKYAATYNIDDDKILVCKIRTDNVKTMTLKEFSYQKKRKRDLDKFDLLIISDCNEYICKNPRCISVISAIKIKRIMKKNKEGQLYLDEVKIIN
jgi:hypothetical protein